MLCPIEDNLDGARVYLSGISILLIDGKWKLVGTFLGLVYIRMSVLGMSVLTVRYSRIYDFRTYLWDWLKIKSDLRASISVHTGVSL